MKKRLFLFAAYNKGAEISQTLIDYLNFLSPLGDIVLCFDSDVSKSELKKLNSIKNILHISSVRHGEYDFGSYKRAYSWAQKNKLLSKYDWTYLVNDSVYCLRFPEYILSGLESENKDLIGMVKYKDFQTPEHVQSWFMGISAKVANSEFMSEFMNNISKEKTKENIVLKYEVMFSRVILNRGFKMATMVPEAHDTTIVYKNPYALLNEGVPFVKKKSIRHIMNINRLFLYSDSEIIARNIKAAVEKNGTKINSDRYICIYKLTVLGIPVFKKIATYDMRAYKGVLFGIPLYKAVIGK